MKHVIFLLNLMLITFICGAQSFTPKVISNCGTQGKTTNYQMSYTIGQTIFGSGASTNYQLNQGFQQSFENLEEKIEICIVTVDTGTLKNIIMWEKKLDDAILSYNIYKETGVNSYDSIGNVPYSSTSKFIDLTSQPESHGDKYKISIIDTNGNESQLSDYHKTMNLTIASSGSTMGLNWDHYFDEGGIFVPFRYYIYRGESPNTMSLLDSVSASFNSYNDVNVFSVYYYMVGVIKPDGCDINRSGDPIMSFSNKKDNSSLIGGLQEYNQKYKLIVFPNPFSENITALLEQPFSSAGYSYTLFDCTGKILLRKTNHTSPEINISKGELSRGLYFLEIEGISILRAKLMIVE